MTKFVKFIHVKIHNPNSGKISHKLKVVNLKGDEFEVLTDVPINEVKANRTFFLDRIAIKNDKLKSYAFFKMTEQELIELFEKINSEIKSKNINGFYLGIKKLFENLSCHCFLNELIKTNKDKLKTQLATIETLTDDNTNYELNVSKAYLYLYNENKEKALFYLNNAIELNQQDDLSYVLRSKVEDNYSAIKDLTKALELNPSSSNYYFLGIANSSSDIPLRYKKKLDFNWLITKNTINLLSKAIELNPMFIHAYDERGSNYDKINRYHEAISDYKKCIELGDESYYYYLSIYSNLIKVGEFEESLTYAIKALDLEPSLNFIQKDLGNIYYNLSDYQKAISHYEEYLLANPNDEEVKNCIEKINNELIFNEKVKFYNEKELAVISAFEKSDYHSCISIFEEIIDNKFIYGVNFESINSFYSNTMNNYLHSILALNGISMQNPETNKIYLELNNLKESGKKKIEDGLELSNDEKNVNKLLSYQYFFKLGFGKYINKEINEVINLNAHYILWCIINIKHFSVENDILALPQFRNQPLLNLAIEYNFIKNIIIEKWFVKEDDSNFDYRDYLERDDYDNSFDSKFYNDELDMDQQSPEFWDSI